MATKLDGKCHWSKPLSSQFSVQEHKKTAYLQPLVHETIQVSQINPRGFGRELLLLSFGVTINEHMRKVF